MEAKFLGTSDLTVAILGLGCNNLGRPNTASATADGAAAVVHAALDEGITFFDVSDTYGRPAGTAEDFLGRALGSRRPEIVLATKFGMDTGMTGPGFHRRGSRAYVHAAVDSSLRRLGTDWIDLYQYHTPDRSTPIEETLTALQEVIDAGKVRFIGHSNMTGWQLADADHIARSLGVSRFVTAQNNYNLIDRRAELEVVPAARKFELGLLPYYPLAGGLLTGKYADGVALQGGRFMHNRQHVVDETNFEQLRSFNALAHARGESETGIALAWLRGQPVISSIIAGATAPEQVRQNVAALATRLSVEDYAKLDAIFPPSAGVAPY